MNTTLQDEARREAYNIIDEMIDAGESDRDSYSIRPKPDKIAVKILAASILRAKAEEAERVGLYFTKLRADELRAAADALEGR